MALTLRLLGGLTVAEIAQAFLVPGDDDGAADHPRQGARSRAPHIPYRVPAAADLPSGWPACWP